MSIDSVSLLTLVGSLPTVLHAFPRIPRGPLHQLLRFSTDSARQVSFSTIVARQRRSDVDRPLQIFLHRSITKLNAAANKLIVQNVVTEFHCRPTQNSDSPTCERARVRLYTFTRAFLPRTMDGHRTETLIVIDHSAPRSPGHFSIDRPESCRGSDRAGVPRAINR